MPPKGSQKTGLNGSQQSSTLTAAFKKLCDHLKKAWKSNGEIVAPDSLNLLIESLRSHRTKATNIEPKFVINLVSNLEKEGIDICSRLDETLFSIIVETIFQSDYCVESERGLFLLSGSLHNYRGTTVNGKNTEKRKDLVGKKCLEMLLTYFTEKSHPSNIRRRVGILCAVLLQGCPKNINRLELMPEALRGSIGEAMVKEENEIVRSICGRLVRTIEAAGVPVNSLWPVDYDKHLYEGFPSTQRPFSWSQQYIDYVDKLILKAKPASSVNPSVERFESLLTQDSLNQLYLHYAKNCELTPNHRFGDSNSNINIYLNDGQMTLLAISPGSITDQILDIPWNALLRINVIFQTESQIEGTAEVIITLQNDDNIYCILDGEGTKMEEVFFSSDIDEIRGLQQELRTHCPGLQLTEEFPVVKQGTDERNEVSQRSYTSDVAIELNKEEPPGMNDRVKGSQSSWVSAEAAEVVNVPMSQYLRQNIPGPQDRASPADRRADPDAPSYQRSNEGEDSNTAVPNFHNLDDDLYNASPPRRQTQREKKEHQEAESGPDPPEKLAESINQSQVPSKNRKSVKPVAKAPIQLSQKPHGPRENAKEKNPVTAKINKQRSKATARNDLSDAKSSKVATSKAKEAKEFESEVLTSPDTNDASTPKITKNVEKDDGDYVPPKRIANTTASESQLKGQKPSATSCTKARNRNAQSLGLGRRVNTTAPNSVIARDVFELPDDDEDEEESQNVKRKGKAPQKASSKSQTKKPAPKKVEVKKRESAPPAIETMPPPKAKPARKRESAPPVVESMRGPPPKHVPDSKKRQSAPSAIEIMPPPPLPQRITRSNKIATSVTDEAESQSQESKAKKNSKTSITEPVPFPRPVQVQNENIAHMDDYSIDQSPGYEKEAVKDTPVKSNDGTKASQRTTIDLVASKSAKNPLINMASKMIDLLDFADTNNEEDNISANDQPIHVSRENEIAVEYDEQIEEDELAEPSNLKPPQVANTSSRVVDDSKANERRATVSIQQEVSNQQRQDKHAHKPTEKPVNKSPQEQNVSGIIQQELSNSQSRNKHVFKVPDRPARTFRGSGHQAIEDRSIEKLEVTPTPRDSTSPAEQSGGSNESRKRKTMTEDTIPSKRSRPSEKSRETGESASPRRSTRIASKLNFKLTASPLKSSSPIPIRAAKKQQNEDLSIPPPDKVHSRNINETQKLPEVTPTAQAPRPSRKPTKAPSRPSPWTGEGAVETPTEAAAPSTTHSKTPLVDDRLARKPGVISFNKYGALNQGVLSTPRLFTEPAVSKSLPSKEASDRKRKHAETNLVQAQSPPKKRKSVSPPDVHVEDYEQYEEADQPQIRSSPPQQLRNPAKLTIGNQSLQLRPSSQGSRVDPNGSPRPSPMNNPIDHFKRIEKKMKEQSRELEEPEQIDGATAKPRPRRGSNVFGPKVKLSSQAKKAPTSLEKSEPRYVAVKKTQNGHYEEVHSKEVIQPQKVLPDPFTGKNSRVSSGFTELLETEAKARGKSQKSQLRGVIRQSLVDPEKTLVNAVRRPRVEQRVPSLSTGTSVDSHSSEPSRSPLRDMDPAEMWNVAVRPHYSTLRQAIHRIADEVIIRLADEEDKMDLLVEEYKENGAKILENIAQKRTDERSKMLEGLEEKKNTMMEVYAATRKSISSSMGKLKQRPVENLAKNWQTEQEFIREKVGEGSVDAD